MKAIEVAQYESDTSDEEIIEKNVRKMKTKCS